MSAGNTTRPHDSQIASGEMAPVGVERLGTRHTKERAPSTIKYLEAASRQVAEARDFQRIPER